MNKEKSKNTVFVVQHTRESPLGHENVKFIGVYTTEEKANHVIEKSKKIKGFRDYPDGFCVDEYELDKDHWVEGFGIE